MIRQLHEQPPSAGQDVYLTLDLNLQRYIEQLLVGSRAAVVVSDPRTGAILAMVSNPSYDPNLFVDGISSKDYQGLLNDPNRPLINRATQGLPARVDGEALHRGVGAQRRVITKNTVVFDPGWWQLPGSEKRFRDWKNGATAG